MKLDNCNNVGDFRKLAKRRLPSPIFHYIDGGADDEITQRRNTAAFDTCDLVPNVLTDVSNIDLGTTVFGQKLAFPLFVAPMAMHRLYHYEGEIATARAAANMGTMFSLSTMSTRSIERVGSATEGTKLFQLYIHRDRGLTDELIERCQSQGFAALCLTVDAVVAGNRERDLVTGFSTPPRLTLKSLLSFATHPDWSLNYLAREKFELSNLTHITKKGTDIDKSIMDYINEQFDPSMSWEDAEYARKKWDGPFALKGIMSVADARKAVDIGATAIMISNHGGRQLDGSRSPFDQLAEIANAVGDQVEIILDGGVRRGTHVLKALSLGATACSVGRPILYALGAAGQAGVEAVLTKLKDELKRDMQLMGCSHISLLNRNNIAYRRDENR
jgi:L-lactate dehydrogenase (cytochrome)